MFRLGTCVIILCLLVSACGTSQPSNINNICHIFFEKDGWYEDAKEAKRHWGAPIPVMMAIMHQESSFRYDAKPPRSKILWVIPWTRPSSAEGYAQATDATWEDYLKDRGGVFSSRGDFGDAIDFVGWYMLRAQKQLGISVGDAYNQYLAYHEGLTGYNRENFRNKPQLRKAAKKVRERAGRYNAQLQKCQAALEDDGFLGLF